MFTYLDEYQRIVEGSGRFPKVAQQCCISCTEWFSIGLGALSAALQEWRNGQAYHNVTMCRCPCGEEQILVMPGKYDEVHAQSREGCAVQFWQW